MKRLSRDFRIVERGAVEIKGKGKMRTWFLLPGEPA